MELLQNILTFLQVFAGVIVMILVLLQDSNERSNIIVSDASKGGNMGSSKNEKLAKLTKRFAIVYVILTIVLSAIMVLATR
ncbi:MAG: preprotein translocase subunit SecG [Clostridia bacterium]|nr:preprotein translocase subunit SecG [Clostridia bacterium]